MFPAAVIYNSSDSFWLHSCTFKTQAMPHGAIGPKRSVLKLQGALGAAGG